MAHSPTQLDFNILNQGTKEYFTKIELLNKSRKIIEVIHGNIINDSISLSMETKQRRSYSCDLHIIDSSFIIGKDKKIWIDKYVRTYYGIKSARSKEIVWYLIGTFTFTDANFSYSETANTLSLTCSDMMSDYDGTKNGEIDGYSLLIPAGEDIRESVIAMIKHAGISNYIVEDIHKEIPYDLEFSSTTTYCDVWTKICELYDSWEFFFDVDGTFIWRQIPTGYHETCIMDDTVLSPLIIDEQYSSTFKGIYNVTEVWGKVLELEYDDRYCYEGVTYSSNTYHLPLPDVTSMDDIDNLTQIAIKIPVNNLAGAQVQINSLEIIPIVHDDGTVIAADKLKGNITYVFMYRRTLNGEIQNALYLLGQYQAYGIYKEMNDDCPFSIGNLGYEILHRVDYDKLYSDDLCYNQAEYLTYQSTAMLDTVILRAIIIPWLEVNQKVKYTSKITGSTQEYIIKNISWSTLDGTMSLTLYKFLESFSYVKNKDTTSNGRRI